MTVRGHTTEVITYPRIGMQAGRPPYAAAPPGPTCGMTIIIPPTRDSPCRNSALWLLPELPRCAHHVPLHLLPLVQERTRLWETFGAVAWLEVLSATPFDGAADG
jgi:hypothetical protein